MSNVRLHFLARRMMIRAFWYEQVLAHIATCEQSAETLRRTGAVLRGYARIILGDIGEDQREIEILPLSEPEIAPVETPAPEPVPASRIDVVLAMSDAAAALGWHPVAASSSDERAILTVRPGPRPETPALRDVQTSA